MSDGVWEEKGATLYNEPRGNRWSLEGKASDI